MKEMIKVSPSHNCLLSGNIQIPGKKSKSMVKDGQNATHPMPLYRNENINVYNLS